MTRQDNSSALIALGILIVAGITDGLDGYFARRRNQISRLGLILDPLADKVMAAALVLSLIAYRDFPVWLALIIVGRDLLILGASAFLIRGNDLVVPSSLVGKYAFASIAVLLASYLIRFEFGIWIMTICSVVLISGSIYVYSGYFLAYRRKREVKRNTETRSGRIARSVFILLFAGYFIYRLYLHLIDFWPG